MLDSASMAKWSAPKATAASEMLRHPADRKYPSNCGIFCKTSRLSLNVCLAVACSPDSANPIVILVRSTTFFKS